MLPKNVITVENINASVNEDMFWLKSINAVTCIIKNITKIPACLIRNSSIESLYNTQVLVSDSIVNAIPI